MIPYCNYISDELVLSGAIGLSIDFLDSDGTPLSLGSSGDITQLTADFNASVPSYTGAIIQEGSPVLFGLSEYQILFGNIDYGITSTPLVFTQSNCINLPQIGLTTTGTGSRIFVDAETLKEMTLIDIWISWFLFFGLGIFLFFKQIKKGF